MTATLDVSVDLSVRDEVLAVARQMLAPEAEQHDRRATFNHAAWQALADTGFWRVPLPPPEGGMGCSWRTFSELVCLLAEHGEDFGFVLSVIAHAGLVRAMSRYGTAVQRDRWLPSLVSGAVGCTALTEPRGGSDVAGTATVAVPAGAGYRLSGTKQHITNAPVADVALVLGRAAGLPARRDITLFMVDCHAPGVRRGSHEDLLGLRSSPTGALELAEVALDEHSVLDRPGHGLATLYNIISYDRLMYGLVAAAALRPMLREATEYAQRRTAFGSPIADHQYVQLRLTDTAIAIHTAESIAWDAHERLFSDDERTVMACSIAKLVGSRHLAASAQDLMCVYGHLGYVDGRASRFLRDAMGTLIAGGTSEMQRKNIFNQMIKSWRSGDEV
jgi:isovaleryl-CoA dehydrogenase